MYFPQIRKFCYRVIKPEIRAEKLKELQKLQNQQLLLTGKFVIYLFTKVKETCISLSCEISEISSPTAFRVTSLHSLCEFTGSALSHRVDLCRTFKSSINNPKLRSTFIILNDNYNINFVIYIKQKLVIFLLKSASKPIFPSRIRNPLLF